MTLAEAAASADELAQREGYRDRTQVTQMMRVIMEGAGLDADAFDGRLDDVRPALFEAKRELGRRRGIDYDSLADEQLTDDFHYFIFPNITLNISADHFWFFRHRPDPADPERMFWDFQTYVRLPDGIDPPPRPDREPAPTFLVAREVKTPELEAAFQRLTELTETLIKLTASEEVPRPPPAGRAALRTRRVPKAGRAKRPAPKGEAGQRRSPPAPSSA